MLDETAASDLSTLALASAATRALADVIQRAPVPPLPSSPSPAQLIHHAIWLMCVSGFRAGRSAMAVIRSGYPDQAVVYVRLITELLTRAQRASRDGTGQYAREWLADRPVGKPAKLIEQDVYAVFSEPAHANARAVREWLTIPREDGSSAVVLGPERRSESANATLSYIGGALIDLTVMLGRAAGLATDHLAPLTAAIVAAQDEHLVDES